MNQDNAITSTAEAMETAAGAALDAEIDASAKLPPLKNLAAAIVITVIGMVAVGLLITLISSEIKQFRILPNLGQVVTDADGNQTFNPAYSHMRRFSYSTPEDPLANSHNYLQQAGMMGTALYFYTITNTLNWALEAQLNYLGEMVFVPFFVILIGCALFFFVFLPREAQTQDAAIFFAILFSGLHAILLILLMFAGSMASNSFGMLYAQPCLNYSGQMIGTMLPGAFVLFFTDMFYGAITGTLLGFITRAVKFVK
ncbi:MAG: hypothetical protein GC154_08080 [bacterium]|nr:hypothetical protein [bacterium]